MAYTGVRLAAGRFTHWHTAGLGQDLDKTAHKIL